MLPWIIAIDGGTSRTRVRTLRAGEIVADISAAVGVRDAALSGSASPLKDRLAEAIPKALAAVPPGEPAPIVVSGMLTSEVGLEAIPHALAPVDCDTLARAATWRTFEEITPNQMLLIPGVRTPAGPEAEGWMSADVMRGEECEVFALWREAPPLPGHGALYLIPGSHTKLVAVDPVGRITSSHTTIAGELLAALSGHTVLAASLPPRLPTTPDPSWFAGGARHARESGLGRAAFGVRLAAISGQGTPEQRASWLVGAVVGDDVDHLVRHPLLRDRAEAILTVGGAEPLRSLYAANLAESWPGRVVTSPLGDTAAATGASLIASRRLAWEVSNG